MGVAQGQMPRREEGRRNSEDEKEQGRASQQLVPLTSGGVNQVAPASSLEQDLPCVRCVLGEGVSTGRPGKRGPSRSPGRPSGMRKEMVVWENWCRKPKRNQNSQGKDPRTFEENRQGRDPCTQERNSQGKDPRTLVENSKCENVSTYQTNSQRTDPRILEAPVKR